MTAITTADHTVENIIPTDGEEENTGSDSDETAPGLITLTRETIEEDGDGVENLADDEGLENEVSENVMPFAGMNWRFCECWEGCTHMVLA